MFVPALASDPAYIRTEGMGWMLASAGADRGSRRISLVKRRTQAIISRSVSGVVVIASSGRNAPTVFTSTSGGPTSPTIRSITKRTRTGHDRHLCAHGVNRSGSAPVTCSPSRFRLLRIMKASSSHRCGEARDRIGGRISVCKLVDVFSTI